MKVLFFSKITLNYALKNLPFPTLLTSQWDQELPNHSHTHIKIKIKINLGLFSYIFSPHIFLLWLLFLPHHALQTRSGKVPMPDSTFHDSNHNSVCLVISLLINFQFTERNVLSVSNYYVVGLLLPD